MDSFSSMSPEHISVRAIANIFIVFFSVSSQCVDFSQLFKD